nr:hypothetical protein [Tanacetum cinerariifolium]
MFSLVWIMPPKVMTQSAGQPVVESRGEGTGVRVGRGGRGRGPREGNDDHVDELNGQGNDQGLGSNGGVEGVNGNVGNQGNVENQNGNVVNENVQKNVGNMLVNRNEPKYTTCNSYHSPGGPCRTCFNCNRPGHLAKDCRGVPWNVNHVYARNPTVRACYECGSTDHVRSVCPRLNRAQGLGGNRPNQVVANNEGHGRGNQENQARGIEPNELGFRYEIEIASGQLVRIDK